MAICLIALASCVVSAASPTPASSATRAKSAEICGITGYVIDTHGNGIGNARVSIYNLTVKNGKYTDAGLTTIDQNPQLTGEYGATAGYYQFSGIPAGTYNITIDVGNVRHIMMVHVDTGVYTAPDTVVEDWQPAPTEVPNVTPGDQPVVTEKATPIVTLIPGPEPSGQQENKSPGSMRLLVSFIVGLQFMACCIVLLLYAMRRI